MGNTNTKESGSGSATGSRGHRPSLAPEASSSSHRSGRPSSRSGRTSRADLGGLLGLTHSGSSTQPAQEQQRRETKQEREARRLEKERQARIAERERSLKEENVDGGYLVTLGTYVGPEDFSKQVVRQLQIERRLAPFWRGLQDFDDNWTEPQIIAAARGVDIPPAGATPPDELVPKPLAVESPSNSTQNLNSLTVPLGARSLSAASDRSVSNLGSTIPSPTTAAPARGSSPFKPRAKALAAALSVGSRNGSQTEIAPREINLPADPFVNGQPTEVFLYKSGSECPICFLYYPPYLNHTRCCDQPICSECFVQIKRPDPHYPEGHGDNADNENANPEEQAGQLISEPACCPYCQQPEFGVTYEAPPFRRGLTYSAGSLTVGLHSTAMSSSSSVNSNTLSPSSLGSPTGGNRRRTQSLSATAPNVITTDRVRPDWSTKLANQRAHIARRAAAATALHTAAFLIGNNSDSRSGFRMSSRFGRRTGHSASPGGRVDEGSPQGNTSEGGEGDGSSGADTARPLGARRNRMEDLEELMFREALRQSLASEEERQRKWEKEVRKEAKKREKEERKAAKAAMKHGSGPYSQGGSGASSATASSLSLSGLVHGRRRGNSGASNLRVEASVASAVAADGNGNRSGSASPVNTTDKGKAIERPPTVPEARTSEEAGESSATAGASSNPAASSSARPMPTPHQPAGPSHLRQMSSASSVTSSQPDSTPNSYTPQSHLHDPRSSGLTLGGASDDGEAADDKDPSNSAEPMFNFSSLAEMVGVQLEGEHAGRRLSAIGRDSLTKDNAAEADIAKGNAASPSQHADKDDEVAATEHDEHVGDAGSDEIDQSIATLKASDVKKFRAECEKQQESTSTSSALAPPQLMITPETPAPVDDDRDESKRLGFATTIESSRTVTQ
ncbi:uncharacterized protein E0L32_002423 [Thyridium curvatum]|uniref:Uncharacterized protein n=1 Tax=Thyridium curvatum TaxID=1093900 RepID=A0A507BGT5_9PEZI|nr:uncharacterized protein E0L32_002423 [Thyridium curvatum]TPX18566.1 hypothetical protein E0L32_002423 [Thyridium curvatum]